MRARAQIDTIDGTDGATDTGPILWFTGEYAWLSNMHQHSPLLQYEGRSFHTLEAAYHSAKCVLESEKDELARLRWGYDAKTFGKIVRMRGDWESVRLEVMGDLLLLKFADPELRQMLVETGERELVHGVRYTGGSCLYWGNYQSDGGPAERGTGENWLGVLLQSVREAVR